MTLHSRICVGPFTEGTLLWTETSSKPADYYPSRFQPFPTCPSAQASHTKRLQALWPRRRGKTGIEIFAGARHHLQAAATLLSRHLPPLPNPVNRVSSPITRCKGSRQLAQVLVRVRSCSPACMVPHHFGATTRGAVRKIHESLCVSCFGALRGSSRRGPPRACLQALALSSPSSTQPRLESCIPGAQGLHSFDLACVGQGLGRTFSCTIARAQTRPRIVLRIEP